MLIITLLYVLSPYTAVIVCFLAGYQLYKHREKVQKNPWNTGLIVLFLWSFFVGIVNKSVHSMIVSFLFFMYFCVSVYIENNWSTEEKIYEVAHYLLYLSIFSGILGLIEKIVFQLYPMTLWRKFLGLPATASSTHRIYSTFGNPNVAGDWFAIMIIIALFYEGCTKDKKKKIFYYSCVTLFLINLFLTGSRGAFVAMAIGLMVLFIFKCSRHNRMIFTGIIIGLILIGFMPNKVPNLSEGLVGHQIHRSLTLRERIWKGSLEMVAEKPLTGWGLTGTIEHGKEFINYSGVVHHSHNIWLALLTSLGWIGLVTYLIMRIYIYKNVFLFLLKNRKGYIQPLVAIQAIIIVHGVVDFTIIAPQIGLLFVATSVMITNLLNQYREVNNKVSTRTYFNNKA